MMITVGDERVVSLYYGLTKRELFAAMALQGMQSENPTLGLRPEILAEQAVEMADALIKALNKPEGA